MLRTFVVILLYLSSLCAFCQHLDIQGHRGARGVFPENSIPGFIYALDQGVTTLEMDVVISKDGKVVVSHEPWMSSEICNVEGDVRRSNIYRMEYDQILAIDCGSKFNGRFPDQIKMQVAKPLLIDVIKSAERHMKGVTLREFDYNIEIKSAVAGDTVYHPVPSEFADIVYNLIDQYLPWQRVVIQSFDVRVLQYIHDKYPEVRLAYLIENERNINKAMSLLGFTPEIYSPDFALLSKKGVAQLHKMSIKVIPWTVNRPDDMIRLEDWGVDGLITDYPNRARELGLTRSIKVD